MSRPRPDIVLVEDEPHDVEVALRALRRAHLEDRVIVLRDGQEARQHLLEVGEGELPAAVLLDVRMPRVDGWELLRMLRTHERTRCLPVVIVSSSARESDIRAAYRQGANSYIRKRPGTKPPGQFLVDAVRYWLELNEVPS